MIPALAAVQNLLRRVMWPILDTALSAMGLYASYPLIREEYAVTANLDLTETRGLLAEIGYCPAPVAAYKQSPRGEGSNGSWVYRRPRLWRSDYQNHVHLVEAGGVTHLYAHNETNWWPSLSDPWRPIRHYRPPEKGGSSPDSKRYPYDWALGQRILMAQLDEAGIEYVFDPGRID